MKHPPGLWSVEKNTPHHCFTILFFRCRLSPLFRSIRCVLKACFAIAIISFSQLSSSVITCSSVSPFRVICIGLGLLPIFITLVFLPFIFMPCVYDYYVKYCQFRAGREFLQYFITAVARSNLVQANIRVEGPGAALQRGQGQSSMKLFLHKLYHYAGHVDAIKRCVPVCNFWGSLVPTGADQRSGNSVSGVLC